MKGFFSRQETQSISRPEGKVLSCVSCKLSVGVNSPKMKPYGNFKQSILVIGEAPGETEDKTGKPWQGKTGRFLQNALKEFDFDLFEDCLSINAVICRPTDKNGNNRTPTSQEISHCRKEVLKVIQEYTPKLILLCGGSAVESIIGHRWQRDLGGIMKWRGWTIPDQDFRCWVCPIFHPSYVERAEQEVETVWMQDLKRALRKVNEKFPRHREPKIDIITDLSVLKTIPIGNIAIDYETTGIKPHAKGHRIISVAVADSEDHAYSFILPDTRREREPLLCLLKNPSYRKIAHNMKYEENWSVNRLKQSVDGWEWDTMIAAHILDNRPGVASLKFQTYVNFGIVDYESEVSPYLQSGSKDGNAMNNILKLVETTVGRENLLTYGGLDVIYEYRLAMLQQKIMNYTGLPF